MKDDGYDYSWIDKVKEKEFLDEIDILLRRRRNLKIGLAFDIIIPLVGLSVLILLVIIMLGGFWQ